MIFNNEKEFENALNKEYEQNYFSHYDEDDDLDYYENAYDNLDEVYPVDNCRICGAILTINECDENGHGDLCNDCFNIFERGVK